MAIKQPQRGFTLLIAVIFMTVMLSFGLALGSLSYKQLVLSSVASESQYAFYAADAATECALYYDQQPSLDATKMACGSDTSAKVTGTPVKSAQINFTTEKRCADVTIYKSSTGKTNIYSQGYNVPCGDLTGGARVVSRAIWTKY